MSLTIWLLQVASFSIAITGCLVVGVALAEFLDLRYMPKILNAALSTVINAYLNYTLPIKHQDGERELPSCPYHWPNGQGDVAKFMDGIENSEAWGHRYGGIYRIWSGTKPEIVLTQPYQLAVVFRDSDKHTKAAANDSGAYMDRLLGKCVGLISGEEWRSVRSIIDHPFTHSVTSNRVANVESQVFAHFDHLQTQGRLKNHLLHPAEDTKMLPFWVVCEIFYGRLPSPLLEELRSLAPQRERIFQYVIQGGLTRFTWSQWLPTTANAELLMFQNRWKAFNDAAHSHALVHHPNSPIVQLYLAQQSGKITTAQLLQTLDESLYANLDVTTGGLSWNLVFLASNKCAQSRLRSEVQLAVVEKRLHDYVKSESTYLAACILESSRLKPLAAFSVPQAAPTAREVDGYVIPAGTNFVVDAYALNIRADTWAPDNGTYRPERFLSRRGTELRYRFWRFGFGPRQCMGKYVAEQVIRLTMVYLVLGYELEMTEKGEEWGRSRESWISHPDFELRCVKREG